MNNVIVYFALKYNGDFDKIHKAIRYKEQVDWNLYEKLKSQLDYQYVTIVDSNYPESLKKINRPPFVLFYKGNFDLINDKCCLVLSTNSFSQTTISINKNVMDGLIKKSCTILSTTKLCVEEETLSPLLDDRRCSSVCILPYMGYGKDNDHIRNDLKSSSLIISEVPFYTNEFNLIYQYYRIITGVAKCLIITELNTHDDIDILVSIKHMLEQEKDIYCVPASTEQLNQGTNKLIQNGAHLITNVDDIDLNF